jgi:hypothetical protein
MFICILVVYLYGRVAKLEAIAAMKALIGRLAARRRLLRRAVRFLPPNGRPRQGKTKLNISPAAARDPHARNP